MAKYLVTNGSHFNPFTYDELAKPIMQAVEAHNATAEAYDTLSSGAEALRQYILREPEDSEARMLYDSYMAKLDRVQNNLWEKGYNANTRRDLSAARAGYQSDITRLATAVKDRSERSAAYWDARHKNPNLVTGRDPGVDALDDYLRDANHGLNWFSYDSAQFEKDVFDETKARAQALYSKLSDPNAIVTNPKLKQELTRVINKGVTNEEVDAASVLVDQLINMSASDRDKFYRANSETVSPVVQMLTESLINRYDATGIRGYDVDANERQKLINRGKAGLAGGVMAPEIKDFTNPEEEFNMWKRKEQWKLDHPAGGSGSSSGSGSGSKKDAGPGYSLQTLATYLDSDESKDILAYTNKKFKKKFEEPIPMVDVDGRADTIESPYDAHRILDELGRSDFIAQYGVDPLNPFGSHKNTDGETVFIGKSGGGYAGNTGKYYVTVNGKRDKELTEQFTADITAFNNALNDWKKKNENLDIESLIVPEKDWDKMSNEYNIPESVPREAYPAILEAKAAIGYRTPAYLVDDSSDDLMKKARVDFASKLYSSYAKTYKDKKGKVDKTSPLAIYKVDPDGKKLYLIRDVREILGVNNNDEINHDTINDISASPEDVISNQIRFTTTNGTSEYSAKPEVFGNEVAAVYRKLREPVQIMYEVNNNGKKDIEVDVVDDKGIVDYMMKPILDPVSAFTMSDEQAKTWINLTAETLADYMQFYSTDSNGKVIGVITPRSIVYSSDLRDILREAVVRYINAGFAGVRDNDNRGQAFRATASNPGASFNLGLTESTE